MVKAAIGALGAVLLCAVGRGWRLPGGFEPSRAHLQLSVGRFLEEANALRSRCTDESEGEQLLDDANEWLARLSDWLDTELPEFKGFVFTDDIVQFDAKHQRGRISNYLERRIRNLKLVQMKL